MYRPPFMKHIKHILSLILITMIVSPQAFCQEELEYKRFRLERAICDAAVLRAPLKSGMDVAVSAIAVGKGSEFRKWTISEIRLNIERIRIRPDKTGKFYVTKESFFQIPAAVLFAAIGTQIDVGGSSLEKGIAKAGAAIGLGLLVLQAKGEIDGEQCVFNLDETLAGKIVDGRDFIEITVENRDLHLKDTVKIGLVRKPDIDEPLPDYNSMSKDELSKTVDDLKVRINTLEAEQGSYRYGKDPEFDSIQNKIGALETKRGLAYRAWYEKEAGQR